MAPHSDEETFWLSLLTSLLGPDDITADPHATYIQRLDTIAHATRDSYDRVRQCIFLATLFLATGSSQRTAILLEPHVTATPLLTLLADGMTYDDAKLALELLDHP